MHTCTVNIQFIIITKIVTGQQIPRIIGILHTYTIMIGIICQYSFLYAVGNDGRTLSSGIYDIKMGLNRAFCQRSQPRHCIRMVRIRIH